MQFIRSTTSPPPISCVTVRRLGIVDQSNAFLVTPPYFFSRIQISLTKSRFPWICFTQSKTAFLPLISRTPDFTE